MNGRKLITVFWKCKIYASRKWLVVSISNHQGSKLHLKNEGYIIQKTPMRPNAVTSAIGDVNAVEILDILCENPFIQSHYYHISFVVPIFL